MALAIETARRSVFRFCETSDDLIGRHKEALDCYNCEAFLQIGIDAYHWLIRADELFRMCVAKGIEEFDENVDKALRLLFRDWLDRCKFANDWVDIQHQRGFEVDNLEQFQRCEEEIRAIVDSFDNEPRMSDDMAKLRDQAIEEFKDGKTAEFI